MSGTNDHAVIKVIEITDLPQCDVYSTFMFCIVYNILCLVIGCLDRSRNKQSVDISVQIRSGYRKKSHVNGYIYLIIFLFFP